jgi:hypothetical protein
LLWVDGVDGDDVYGRALVDDGGWTRCSGCCTNIPRSAAIRATSGRDGRFRWKALRPGHYGLELAARAKPRDQGSFLGDVLPSPRVVHVAGRPAAPLENAESGNGDTVAGAYRPHDLVNGGAQQGGRFSTIGSQFSCEFLDELCFVHCLLCFPVSGLAELRGRSQMFSAVTLGLMAKPVLSLACSARGRQAG